MINSPTLFFRARLARICTNACTLGVYPFGASYTAIGENKIWAKI